MSGGFLNNCFLLTRAQAYLKKLFIICLLLCRSTQGQEVAESCLASGFGMPILFYSLPSEIQFIISKMIIADYWELLHELGHISIQEPSYSFPCHPSGLKSLDFLSCDSKYIALTYEGADPEKKRSFSIFDTASGQRTLQLPVSDGPSRLMAIDDLANCASLTQEDSSGEAYIYTVSLEIDPKVSQWQKNSLPQGANSIFGHLRYSRTGEFLLTTELSELGSWVVLIKNGKIFRKIPFPKFKGGRFKFRDIAMSPDNSRIALCTDSNLMVWNIESDPILITHCGNELAQTVSNIEFISNNLLLVVHADFDHSLQTFLHQTVTDCKSVVAVWDIEFKNCLRYFPLDGFASYEFKSSVEKPKICPAFVLDLHYIPEKQVFVIALYDGRVQVWDIQSGRRVATIYKKGSVFNNCRMSKDLKRIITFVNTSGNLKGRTGYSDTCVAWSTASLTETVLSAFTIPQTLAFLALAATMPRSLEHRFLANTTAGKEMSAILSSWAADGSKLALLSKFFREVPLFSCSIAELRARAVRMRSSHDMLVDLDAKAFIEVFLAHFLHKILSKKTDNFSFACHSTAPSDMLPLPFISSDTTIAKIEEAYNTLIELIEGNRHILTGQGIAELIALARCAYEWSLAHLALLQESKKSGYIPPSIWASVKKAPTSEKADKLFVVFKRLLSKIMLEEIEGDVSEIIVPFDAL